MFYHLEILNRNFCNYVFESPDKTAFTWVNTSETGDIAPDHWHDTVTGFMSVNNLRFFKTFQFIYFSSTLDFLLRVIAEIFNDA